MITRTVVVKVDTNDPTEARRIIERTLAGATPQVYDFTIIPDGNRGIPTNQVSLCPRCGGTRPTCCSCVAEPVDPETARREEMEWR
jgi:hypothetical protein